MIHACKDRLWYVEDYLVPSMEAQGIVPDQITIWLDKAEKGCLESCMGSFASLENEGGTWHLQDDVIICRDFKERTEEYDDGIVCGISTMYDNDKRYDIGQVDIRHMWYSFPCMRIPNEIAIGCANWYYEYIKNNPVYKYRVQDKKHDDEVFRDYLKLNRPKVKVTNLAPNLVDHIDYLLGGSMVNKQRGHEVRALSFNDLELVDKLKIDLQSA